MKSVNDIIKGALQELIDKHGVVVSALNVKVIDTTTMSGERYTIKSVDADVKIIQPCNPT